MVWNPDLPNVKLLYSINCITTGLSLIGCIATCIFYFRARFSSNISLRFVLAITLADLFYSISNLMSAFEGQTMNNLCYIEAFIRQCSWILSVFFATCLSILCCKASSKNKHNFNQGAFFKKSLVIGFLICAILTSM